MYFVYVIKNKYSSKVYVGSTNNYRQRLRNHMNRLKKGPTATESYKKTFTDMEVMKKRSKLT